MDETSDYGNQNHLLHPAKYRQGGDKCQLVSDISNLKIIKIELSENHEPKRAIV